MKTSFTPDQVRQLLALPETRQQEILDYSDMLSEASDEEIVNSAVADDAPELIHELHRLSVRRARAAINRRKRKMLLSSNESDDNGRLSHGAERRIQWLRDSFQSEIGEALRSYIDRVINQMSTLSPGQKMLASRRARSIIVQHLRPLLAPLVAC